MLKRSRLITFICILTLIIVAMLSVTLITIIPQLSGDSANKLVFTSETLEASYDGNFLKADGWELTEGVLKSGHTAVVSVNGSQRNVGTSENHFTVKIKDANGVDVTDEYSIECVPGTLKVKPVVVTITSASDAKVYDGAALENKNYTVLPSYAIPPKHTLEVDITGSVTEIGASANTISGIHIYNEAGKDISYNFDIVVVEGVLTVAKDAASLPGGAGSDVNVGSLLDGIKDLAGLTSAIDISGMLGAPEGAGSGAGAYGKAAYVVTTDRSGKIYMKVLSFGDYSGNSWGDAYPYHMLIDGKYAASYLTSLAMANGGASLYNANITVLNGQMALPYYLNNDSDNMIQLSDTYMSGDTSGNIVCTYYDQNYSYAQLPEEYASYELAYRSFVYENYLEIDEETYDYMLDIIDANGFSRSSPTVVSDIAEYIRDAAKYDLKYDRKLDQQENVVIAFLDEYKVGICQHYASAATLLYRALGIPARYTVGFAASVMKNTTSQVSTDSAHAWVEVYIDGIGWVVSEVTGAASTGTDEPDTPPVVKKYISIAPVTVDKQYDGTPLVAADESRIDFRKSVIAEYMDYATFAKSYTYEAVISGERTEPGKSKSTIESFIIYDKSGNDVTDEFEILIAPGIIHVYVEEISFMSVGRQKVYDGTPLMGSEDDIIFLSNNMLDGHTYSVKMSSKSQITNVGAQYNNYTVTIYDETHNDVTDIYKIKTH